MGQVWGSGVPTHPGPKGFSWGEQSTWVKCLRSRARLSELNSIYMTYYNVTLTKFLNLSVPQYPYL
jgi:hypothetical protein